jgi:hypothetical protein
MYPKSVGSKPFCAIFLDITLSDNNFPLDSVNGTPNVFAVFLNKKLFFSLVKSPTKSP